MTAAFTKGPVEIHCDMLGGRYLVRDSAGTVIARLIFIGSEERGRQEANATLIAEAFNVATETGLTPAQLSERNRALVGALEKFVAIMDSEEDGGEGIFEERLERLLPDAKAALRSWGGE